MKLLASPPKRIRPVFVLSLIILLVAVSVALRSRAQPDRTAATLEAVKRSLGAQQDAWNRGDLDGFMASYWEADELTFISGDSGLTGWQSVMDHYRNRYLTDAQPMGSLSMTWRMEALESNIVLVCGQWQVVGENQKSSGLFSRIYKKLPVGWRVIHENTTL